MITRNNKNKRLSSYSEFYNSQNENSVVDSEIDRVRTFDNDDQILDSIKLAFPDLIVTSSLDTNPIKYDICKSDCSKSAEYSIRIFNDGLILVRYLSDKDSNLKTYRKAKVKNIVGAIKLIKKIEAETELDRLEKEKIYDEEFNENNIFKKKSNPVFDVDADDLQVFIRKNLNQTFEIAAELELGHDDIYEVSAQKNVMGDDDMDELNDWIKNAGTTNGFSMICHIMNYMCDKGLIEEGDYIITQL